MREKVRTIRMSRPIFGRFVYELQSKSTVRYGGILTDISFSPRSEHVLIHRGVL